jgi:uncharacterized protein (UPF0371 family)
MKKGFDSKKYFAIQGSEILKRRNLFDRLYLEIGGKLVYDLHASRVLPGYKKTTKIDLLKSFDVLEIIYCVNAKDLISSRHLGDFDLDYKKQVLKDIKDIKKKGLGVDFVCITRYEGEKGVDVFKKLLEKKGIEVIVHHEIKNYLGSVDDVLKAYSKEKRIPIKKKLVVVTGPAGGSGKMSTALNQIYLDRKKGIKSGFAKYETFPIWNLPLNHPVNVAYEAATADLGDVNMIDPYHEKAYGVKAVNYNRDIENFEILKNIGNRLFLKDKFPYKSPTDMGVNMAKEGIIDDEVCSNAAIKEIKRRWKIYSREFEKGRESEKTLKRMKEILKKVKIKDNPY